MRGVVGWVPGFGVLWRLRVMPISGLLDNWVLSGQIGEMAGAGPSEWWTAEFGEWKMQDLTPSRFVEGKELPALKNLS